MVLPRYALPMKLYKDLQYLHALVFGYCYLMAAVIMVVANPLLVVLKCCFKRERLSRLDVSVFVAE